MDDSCKIMVETAETAGFCFGVKRAVGIVYDQLEHPSAETEGLPVYTFGPIIHNEDVVGDLRNRGVKVIPDEDGLRNAEPGVVVVRSHGIPEKTAGLIVECGHVMVDATCPFVKRIHREAKERSGEGKHVVIIGNREHPEVEGICGYCSGDPTVIGSAEEAGKMGFHSDAEPASEGEAASVRSDIYGIRENEPVAVMVQTTFPTDKFKEIVEILENKDYNITNCVNTICSATKERQSEAGELSERSDIMIVIGSQGSSNTRKLYDICREHCDRTFMIAGARELEDIPELKALKELCKKDSDKDSHKEFVVGITAGASTPQYIIEEVQTYVRTNI